MANISNVSHHGCVQHLGRRVPIPGSAVAKNERCIWQVGLAGKWRAGYFVPCQHAMDLVGDNWYYLDLLLRPAGQVLPQHLVLHHHPWFHKRGLDHHVHRLDIGYGWITIQRDEKSLTNIFTAEIICMSR